MRFEHEEGEALQKSNKSLKESERYQFEIMIAFLKLIEKTSTCTLQYLFIRMHCIANLE